MKGLTADLVQILADPHVRENVGLLTYEQYFAAAQRGELPEKTELLEGMVFHSMPKSPLHANIIRHLVSLLQRLLPSGYFLSQESPLAIPQAASAPEPDIMVCRGSEADYWHQHPQTAELVIEIAVTSTSLDRYKAKLYALAGVREYWLLDAESRRLEIFCEPENGRYLKVEIIEDEVASHALPQIRFKLNQILPPLG
ncbi:MAG: Uma2 family endonuclease [Leptospiraceae bacterium]|nr:Uma2 family endonuclease [Leptospiraceae bacterium]